MSSDHPSPFSPTERMLRQFSGIWIAFCGAMALYQELHHHRHTAAAVLAILAVTVGPAGLLWPRLIKPLFLLLMLATYPIGWVISNTVLLAIFIFLFTP